jgi:chitinase
MKKLKLIILLLLCSYSNAFFAQKNKKIDVIAYYMGDDKQINEYDVSTLTHIIYSFCHLEKGKLTVDNAQDSTTIKRLVALKTTNPKLKIMLSLGGWGGCEPCSDVFSTAEGRTVFAKSVKEVNDYFQTDGIDLDWEYPAIEGLPGHLYQAADKQNFTELIKSLRTTLGENHEISFAAGGFQKFLDESIEWKIVMPLVNRVNIMSYDLVNGYSKVTGHHTPIYSVNNNNEESTDKAIQYLLNLGIPAEKLVIGAAFYTRIWKNVADVNQGLYQSGEHIQGVSFKDYTTVLTPEKGWNYFWDNKAKAAYWYNAKEKMFATGDDVASVKAKTEYAIKNKLGGIMFWELTSDTPKDGLLDAINTVKMGR